jgi:hypothetical protein
MIVKFDENTKSNLIEDFKRYVSQLDNFQSYNDNKELLKMAFIWFSMGHANSMDKESAFNKNFTGDNSNTNTH